MDRQGPVHDRNPALDFSKGVLVLFMVLYHWVNYFVGIEGSVYTYLRFIPPSFIFITGFLIANVYPARHGFSSAQVYRRLVVRGFKLLVLFTLLNIGANIAFARSYKGAMPGVDGFIRDAAIIFTSGNAKAAFAVLVPISYLLLLSAVIFFVCQAHKRAIPFICMGLFLGIVALDVHGLASLNLTLLGIGLLGVLAGMYPIEEVNAWVDHPFIVACLNVSYLFVISVWGTSYVLQAIGVCLSVMIIYLIGMKSAALGKRQQLIILLGQYSLFAYVAQIGLLQLLQRLLPYLSLHDWALWIISFFGAFVLTIITVRVVHQIRAKSYTADWLYRVAFS